MPQSKTSILIVGAGPTGLMLACLLARFNIPFRIIDKKPESTLGSNATWMQTRTLEIFDEMAILDRFLRAGHQCHAIHFYSYGEPLLKISLSGIQSDYKFVLQLPQSETEKILIQHLQELDHRVERPKELLDCQQDAHGVQATIGYEESAFETIECDWLVACDGANSMVREKSGIVYTSDEIDQEFIVADVEMDSVLKPDEINIFFDAGTVLAIFPLKNNKFRINANLYTEEERYGITQRLLKKLVLQRSYRKCQIQTISEISPYFIHNRLVNRMRHERILFAGDAAHVHPPAGGQGMNLGIQDAYNLAWKLAYVVSGKAPEGLLDSYHAERYPIIKKIVGDTKLLTHASLLENFLLIDIRNFGFNILNKHPFTSSKFGDRITQLNLRYKNSPIIDYHEFDVNSPQPGSHMPDVPIGHSFHLNHYLDDTSFNVLIFTGNDFLSKKILNDIKSLQEWLQQDYSPWVISHVVTDLKTEGYFTRVIPDNGWAFEKYHISSPAIYVIRPDRIIAYCSNKLERENLQRFFKQALLRKCLP